MPIYSYSPQCQLERPKEKLKYLQRHFQSLGNHTHNHTHKHAHQHKSDNSQELREDIRNSPSGDKSILASIKKIFHGFSSSEEKLTEGTGRAHSEGVGAGGHFRDHGKHKRPPDDSHLEGLERHHRHSVESEGVIFYDQTKEFLAEVEAGTRQPIGEGNYYLATNTQPRSVNTLVTQYYKKLKYL